MMARCTRRSLAATVMAGSGKILCHWPNGWLTVIGSERGTAMGVAGSGRPDEQQVGAREADMAQFASFGAPFGPVPAGNPRQDGL